MVVADGAARREPHPDRGGRLRAIPRGEHEVFLGDDAPFVRRHVAAVEAAGDLRVENGVDVATRQFLRDEISGELQDREPVERHVLVEGADYPLPVGPHLAEVVEVDAVGVAVAGIVEPVAAAVLAPLRLHEQAVDEPFVGVGVGVGHERLHVGRLGGQARDVEREPAGERPPVGFGGGREALLLEPREDEPVDRVLYPRCVIHRRRLRPLRWNERPVGLVLRPLPDPPQQQVFLGRRERLLHGRRRHHLVGVVGKDPVEGHARIGVARNDRAALDCRVPLVEPQVGLASGAVGPVTAEAVFDQDRSDVLVVREFTGGDYRAAGQKSQHGDDREAGGLHGRSLLQGLF